LNLDWAIIGGLFAGALAGAAARFGKLCTMSAIEDALVGRDYRGAKAWGLALSVAIAATQLPAVAGWVDLGRNPYASPQVHFFGALLGGAIFGLGMTLAGTCSFGLLVRAGGGDLRALMAALIVGIFAFALTAGALAPLRAPLLALGLLDLSALGGASLRGLFTQRFGETASRLMVAGMCSVLIATALGDRRLRKRPRLLAGACVIGLAIAFGWLTTSRAVDALVLDRPESLSFVAPVGRLLLQFMIEPLRNVGFGVAATCGVLTASFLVAWARGDVRWEAFDDAHEMRRHLFGAALMGIGGVLAQGCTIGQGLSAASTLAVSAPVFMIGVLCGAKIGLRHLIEGTSLWRLGRS
jgi:uncharacterized protein